MITAAIVGAALALRASAADYTDKTIHIAIAHQVGGLTIEPEGDFLMRDKERVRRLKAGKRYPLVATAKGLRLGELALAGPAQLAPELPGNAIFVGSKRYRGKLLLRRDERQTVTIVAEMTMENYLLGVLPFEMEPNWPLEALKAQAVVARTFAYNNLGKYRKSGFDLTSDTRSQMYGGLGRDSLPVRMAVNQTRGEVLGYDGQILSVFYHACCGGQTADAGVVWPTGRPTPKPLRGVRDRYCVKSPHFRWTVYFTDAAVLAAAATARLVGGKLRGIKVAGRDRNGNAQAFAIRAGAETLTVKAVELRKRLGASELKSTRILDIRSRKGGVEFTGRGSGHGVGLCQWGARLQAEEGRSYEQILKFYFPGSVLSVVDE